MIRWKSLQHPHNQNRLTHLLQTERHRLAIERQRTTSLNGQVLFLKQLADESNLDRSLKSDTMSLLADLQLDQEEMLAQLSGEQGR